MDWQEIGTAPKGTGGNTQNADYIPPPEILLLFAEGQASVGYWDWYYAEGGRGYEGGLAWIEPISGERLDMYYDDPVGWMPLSTIDS